MPISKPTIKRAVIKAELREGFKVISRAGSHTIVQDLPKTAGGGDEGPSPTEVLLAALAGCIGVVARFHAPKFGIKLEGLEIEVTGEYDVRGFMGEAVKPGFTSIKAKVKVKAEGASRDVISEFMKFVEAHCPISDTIVSGCRVEIEVST
ncbi:MAG: OsmC family protein [Desulfurococcales archaeon]|nr:OsmC family protein [Desulfurococcales archaeon]